MAAEPRECSAGGAPGEGTPPRGAVGGAVYFVIFVVLWAGLIVLGVGFPEDLARTALPISRGTEIALFGANLAVVYGIGLAILAILFTVSYLRRAVGTAK